MKEIKQYGFTLVEMMIALVLSSIIFVSAYQVISNLIQYQVRARTNNQIISDQYLLKNLLTQIIEKSILQYDLFYRIEKMVLFKGEANSLQLLSRAYSENFDVPGYRLYRLYRHNHQLMVSYRKYDKNFRSNQQFELSSGLQLKSIRFEYLNQDNWVESWQDKKNFPSLIRVKVELDDERTLTIVRQTSRK